MDPRTPLYACFAILALGGAFSGYYIASDSGPPRLIEFTMMVTSSVLIYVWYYLDAAQRRYRRTLLLGGGVIMLPFVAVPYYLARSRARGERFKAVLKFFGLGVLSIVVPFLAALLVALVAAR
jgi:hypothetical protein